MNIEIINELNNRFKNKSSSEILKWFLKESNKNIALSSSLSIEDQVITDMICKIDATTNIFTLDTGRLFQETYSLLNKTNSKYKINIKVYFPNTKEVEDMITNKGINLFYNSAEDRKECCTVRKINPLKRAFENLDIWICGLRNDQSITRKDTQLVEWDKNNNIIKLNPIINWKESEVWDYIKEHDVPFNSLHLKDFPSIGCSPCTRAITKDQEIRDGRWWWENPEQKECGLHSNNQ